MAEYCINSVNPARNYKIIGHHQSHSPVANNYRNFVYHPHSIHKKTVFIKSNEQTWHVTPLSWTDCLIQMKPLIITTSYAVYITIVIVIIARDVELARIWLLNAINSGRPLLCDRTAIWIPTRRDLTAGWDAITISMESRLLQQFCIRGCHITFVVTICDYWPTVMTMMPDA